MSWYHMPATASRILFVVLLLAAVLQALAALQAGELLLHKRARRFLGLRGGAMAAVSVVLMLEAMLAVAAVEGGVLLPIPAELRYVAFLPAAVFLSVRLRPVRLPAVPRPYGASLCVPLLLLPPLDRLPEPLPILSVMFIAFWLLFDAARLLYAFREHARLEITRGAIAQIIRSIDHGVCVADRRGRILEANPAFYRQCEGLGIPAFHRLGDLETILRELESARRLEVTQLGDGSAIRAESGVWFYRHTCFQSGRRTFVELSLSDVTEMAHTATALERENASLALENLRLERVISGIGLEAAARERDKLSRAVHDLWSQRLAVAGLTVDILLDDNNDEIPATVREELTGLLEAPEEADPIQAACSLNEVLESLSAMYQKLGVDIRSNGGADFTAPEQEALGAVLKEALANAVRHAYARRIDLIFFENAETRGAVIRNGCLDNARDITEGRGLADMEARVRRAGGTLSYIKGGTFELQAAFPREPADVGEAVGI